MSDSILHISGLSKRYGTVDALHGIDFSMQRGEVLGFLGPNGAGKSTTMKIVTGFIMPSAGTVLVDGKNIAEENLATRRAIGYLPQHLPLYEDMTVTAYLDHVARLKGIPANKRRFEIVRVIEAAHLQEVAKRHCRKLSGGNRQRVGLAQALLGDPALLVLDEPTAGLDPAQVAYFRELINGLAGKHSILLSTHIMSEVEACCHRVVLINKGSLILDESIAAFQERTHQVQRLSVRLFSNEGQAFSTAISAIDGIQVLENDERTVSLECADDLRPRVVEMAGQHGGLRELSEERRSLEDVFRDLTTQTAS